MINPKQVAENIINIAKKKGCGVHTSFILSESRDVSLRKGEIERLLTSTSVSTGIRLFKGKKNIILSFSGEDFADMESRIKTALDSIEYLNEDPYRRMLTQDEFSGDIPDLDLVDNKTQRIDIGKVKEALNRIEQAALKTDKRIIPSDTADFSDTRLSFHLYTSEGVAKSYLKSMYSFSYTAVAEQNGFKERDFWSEGKRHFDDLPSINEIGMIGEKAAQRAIKRMGGKKIKSGVRKVIFTWRTADNLLDLLCNAMDGEEVVLKNSFLVDRVGELLFPEHVTIIDDPLIQRKNGSYPFDGEGMTGKTKPIVDKGRFMTYLHNSYSAGKLNMQLTGNASHAVSTAPHITMGNFYLQSGKGTLDELIHEMKEGLLVEDLFVSGVNSVTGDFSFGCSGYLVENGIITTPVKEITIAGNILELFRQIVGIADDNPWRSSISSPSILVSNLAIAGN